MCCTAGWQWLTLCARDSFAVDSIHNSWTYDEAVKHCPTMSPRSTTGLACDKRRYTIPVAQLRAFLRKLRQPAPGATGEDDDTPTKPLQAVDMDAIIAGEHHPLLADGTLQRFNLAPFLPPVWQPLPWSVLV